MPRFKRLTSTALLLIGAASLAACTKAPPKQLPPEPGPATTTTESGGSSGVRGPVPGSQADFVASMAGQDVIHFELDKYNISPEAAAALRTQAAWLSRYPNKKATIEGHCDERGTRDYNIALGDRRANAAKNYLVSLGVGADRINTVSYGKERPVALGSDEASWAQNRRAVTVTID